MAEVAAEQREKGAIETTEFQGVGVRGNERFQIIQEGGITFLIVDEGFVQDPIPLFEQAVLGQALGVVEIEGSEQIFFGLRERH